VAAPVHPANGSVAGVGVTQFATLSTGGAFDPVSSYGELQKKRLAREQRKLARKVKHHKNWSTGRLHIRIARAQDQHRVSARPTRCSRSGTHRYDP